MLNLGQLWLVTLLAPNGAYTTFQKLPIYRVKSTYQGANFATFSVYPCTSGVAPVSPILMGPLMVKFYHKPMGKFYHKSYGKILTPPGGRFLGKKREKVGRKYKDIFLRIISEDFYH